MNYIFLADGFEEVEALTAVDILKRANIEIETVGIGKNTVMGAHKIKVVTDLVDSDVNVNNIRLVILPGGMPGSANLQKSDVVNKCLDNAFKNDGLVCAICAAPFILGERGNLQGKKAVCFPGFEEKLIGAKIQNTKVCVDGNIITAVGVGAAIEFALAICEKIRGKETAERVKREILWSE
ncbi:MAG: DJ-1/PfpI family protein [Oscillospiraceae bacterium]